jgi:hypothetical protein
MIMFGKTLAVVNKTCSEQLPERLLVQLLPPELTLVAEGELQVELEQHQIYLLPAVQEVDLQQPVLQ